MKLPPEEKVKTEIEVIGIPSGIGQAQARLHPVERLVQGSGDEFGRSPAYGGDLAR